MPEITRIEKLMGSLKRVEADISRFSSAYDAKIRSAMTQAGEWPESFDDKFKMIRSISQSIKINYGKLSYLQKMAIKLREELSKLTPPIPEEKLEALNEKIKKLLANKDECKEKITAQLSNFQAARDEAEAATREKEILTHRMNTYQYETGSQVSEKMIQTLKTLSAQSLNPNLSHLMDELQIKLEKRKEQFHADISSLINTSLKGQQLNFSEMENVLTATFHEDIAIISNESVDKMLALLIPPQGKKKQSPPPDLRLHAQVNEVVQVLKNCVENPNLENRNDFSFHLVDAPHTPTSTTSSKTTDTKLSPSDRGSPFSFLGESSLGLTNSNTTSSSYSFLEDSLRRSASLLETTPRKELITPTESKLNQLDLSVSQNKIGRAIQALKKLQQIYRQKDLLDNQLLISEEDILAMQKKLQVHVEALTTLLQDKKLTNEAAIMHNTNELIIESSYAIRDALVAQREQLTQRFQALKEKLHLEIWDLENPFEEEFSIGQETSNEPLARLRQQLQLIEKLHQNFESNFEIWENYLTDKMPSQDQVVNYNNMQWLDNLQRVCDESQKNTLPHEVDSIFEKVIDLEAETNYIIHYQEILEETEDYKDSIQFIQHMQDDIEAIQQKNKRDPRILVLKGFKQELIENLSQYEKALYKVTQDLDQETFRPSEEKVELLKINLKQTIKYTIQKMAVRMDKDLFKLIKPHIFSSYKQASIYENISSSPTDTSQTKSMQQRFKDFTSALRGTLVAPSSKEEQHKQSTTNKKM